MWGVSRRSRRRHQPCRCAIADARWTDARKQLLPTVRLTRAVVEALSRRSSKPRAHHAHPHRVYGAAMIVSG